MKKIPFLFHFLFLCSYIALGQVINSDTHIKNEAGSYWVYDKGSFTLNNKNTDAAVTFGHLKISDNGILNVSPQTSVTVIGNLI